MGSQYEATFDDFLIGTLTRVYPDTRIPWFSGQRPAISEFFYDQTFSHPFISKLYQPVQREEFKEIPQLDQAVTNLLAARVLFTNSQQALLVDREKCDITWGLFCRQYFSLPEQGTVYLIGDNFQKFLRSLSQPSCTEPRILDFERGRAAQNNRSYEKIAHLADHLFPKH